MHRVRPPGWHQRRAGDLGCERGCLSNLTGSRLGRTPHLTTHLIRLRPQGCVPCGRIRPLVLCSAAYTVAGGMRGGFYPGPVCSMDGSDSRSVRFGFDLVRNVVWLGGHECATVESGGTGGACGKNIELRMCDGASMRRTGRSARFVRAVCPSFGGLHDSFGDFRLEAVRRRDVCGFGFLCGGRRAFLCERPLCRLSCRLSRRRCCHW